MLKFLLKILILIKFIEIKLNKYLFSLNFMLHFILFNIFITINNHKMQQFNRKIPFAYFRFFVIILL